MERQYILMVTTVPNRKEGERIASALVEGRFVACVSISSPVTSLYHWQGAVCKDEEFILLMKTKKKLFQKVETEIKRLHPYEVPEIIGLPIEAGSKDYLAWITNNTLSAE